MYRYFVSFKWFTNCCSDLGNIIIGMERKIEDLQTEEEMENWIKQMQKQIAKKIGFSTIFVLNYQYINFAKESD